MNTKPARIAARTARIHPVDAFIIKIVNTQPDPPRTIPLIPILLLVVRGTWWRLALLIFPIWGIFALVTIIVQEHHIRFDQILFLILITLWLLFFLWEPWRLGYRMWTHAGTGKRASATVGRAVGVDWLGLTPTHGPPRYVQTDVRVVSAELGVFEQHIVIAGELATVTVPGTRLEVLVNPRSPDIWEIISEQAPAALDVGVPAFPGQGAVDPTPTVVAEAVARHDKLGAYAARVLAAQPEPPRQVPFGEVLRVVLTLRTGAVALGLSLLVLLGAGLLILGPDIPYVDRLIRTIIGLALLPVAIYLLVMLFTLTGRVQAALQRGVRAESDVLSAAFNPNPVHFKDVPAQRATGWRDPTVWDAIVYGRAVGRRVVSLPQGTFKENFIIDRAWAWRLARRRPMARGRRIVVLADPIEQRVMLDIALVPPAADDAVIVPSARAIDKWALIFLASGLVFLVITGHTWFRVQEAKADIAGYQTTPICAPGITTGCYEVRGATVLATRVEKSGSKRPDRNWVTLRFDNGQTREILDIGPDFACCDPAMLVKHNLDLASTLQPGMPVEAEYWAGTLTLLRGSRGKLLIAEGFPPYQARENERQMFMWALCSGVCLLLSLVGVLGPPEGIWIR